MIFPLADEAVDSILRALGEHRYIFVNEEDEPRPHPYIQGDTLFVRGTEVLKFTTEDVVDRLLIWGVSFTVFAEKLSYAKCRHTATLMGCIILRTDRMVGSKILPKLATLLKELDG